MKLIHQFDMSLEYEGALHNLSEEGAEAPQFCGEGGGRSSGNGYDGVVHWDNAPSLRDGVFTPNMRVTIALDTGESLTLGCRGYSLLPRNDEPDYRRFTTLVDFHSRAERLRWLKTAVGVQEGLIHIHTRKIVARVYVVDNDLPLP